MAPKKHDEPEKKPLIGRVGTNLRIGIVGVPNVGKVRSDRIKVYRIPRKLIKISSYSSQHFSTY